MGCDIHMVLERKTPATEWLGIWSSDVGPCKTGRHPVASRDYHFFAEVARVRGHSDTGLYPRNLPVDISRLAWLQFMQAPTDYHSPSHLSLTEFLDAYRRANPEGRDYRPEFASHDLFGISTDWPEDCEYRVVFWFDN
jgi:hypothetical protein